MPSRLLLTILALALVAPSPVSAQATAAPPPKPPTVSGLTVVAPPDLGQRKDLRPKIEDFVGSYGAPAPLGQLARWYEKVCPAVSGLSAQENARVDERIRAVAAEVGAPVADTAQCERSVSVFFTDDPQHVLDVIRTKASMFLGYHYPAQTRRLSTFKGPIGVWYTTGTRGANGQLWVDDTRYRKPGGDPGSRITSLIASEFAGVVIIADKTQLTTYDLESVADYVSMIALSETTARGTCQPLPTITNLFATGCPARVERLTSVDVAYLKALYATDPRLKLEFQQAELVWKMERSLGH